MFPFWEQRIDRELGEGLGEALARQNGDGIGWLDEQIRAQVAMLVDQGALGAGTRLASTRVLAEVLGVNRSTVYRAYQDLWAQGYEARPGSYSTVRARLRPPATKAAPTAPVLDFESLSAPGPGAMFGKTRWMAQPLA